MKIISQHIYSPSLKPTVRLVSDGKLLNMKAVSLVFCGSDIVWARDLTFAGAVKQLWGRAYHLYGLRWDQERRLWLEESRDFSDETIDL